MLSFVVLAVAHPDFVLGHIEIVEDQVAEFLSTQSGVEQEHDDHSVAGDGHERRIVWKEQPGFGEVLQ